jgi:tetratricopeptide (TPR) repeat protein
MIEGLVSGQAASYAILGKSAIVRDLDGGECNLPRGQVGLAFQGCSDVRQVKAKSENELIALCKSERNFDRALRLFLMLLESEKFDAIAKRNGELLEGLLGNTEVKQRVEEAMYVAALPAALNLALARSNLRSLPHSLDVLNQLAEDQERITFVRRALDSVPATTFENDASHRMFLAMVFSSGFQRELVQLLRLNKDIELSVLKLVAKFRNVEGARAAIQLWTASMRSVRRAIPITDVVIDETEFVDEPEKSSGQRSRRIYEQIRIQQSAIEERLKSRDLNGARRFASQLVDQQASNSTKEQIGKTLSRLSSLAKQLGVPELQLEWAEQAVQQNPHDEVTFAHLVDALICGNRLYDAARILDELEGRGDTLFLRTSRARLSRLTGNFTFARAQYLSAAQEFANSPNVMHAKAGAAETLRDLGRFDEALREYEELTISDPLNEFFRCGLASVYMDLGQFDKAILNFGRASSKKSSVARNGKASAYKLAGKFDAALRLYDQVIRDYPNDPIGLCGKAEVYRSQGNLDEALIVFELAIERSPFTPAPVAGKLQILREQGRFEDAEQLMQTASETFPYDQGIASGYADILKERGQLQKALSAYDSVIQKFPYSTNAFISRASTLRSLGRDLDALRDYDLLFEIRPFSTQAKLAKASLLIEMGDLNEAEKLLPEKKPQSQSDWNRYLLKAMLYQARGQKFKSQKQLEFGMVHSPFVKQRRLFSAAFARQKIELGEPSVAVKVVDARPNEVSEVIRLHALAASGRGLLAKRAWEDFLKTPFKVSSEISEVANEIARRFRIVESSPIHSLEWIYRTETQIILRESVESRPWLSEAA